MINKRQIHVWFFHCWNLFFRQALQLAALQGGPPAPVLPDLWYFDDDFTFQSGQELTKIYKLRSISRKRAKDATAFNMFFRDNELSTRCVSTCCFWTLFVHHPGYQVGWRNDNLKLFICLSSFYLDFFGFCVAWVVLVWK